MKEEWVQLKPDPTFPSRADAATGCCRWSFSCTALSGQLLMLSARTSRWNKNWHQHPVMVRLTCFGDFQPSSHAGATLLIMMSANGFTTFKARSTLLDPWTLQTKHLHYFLTEGKKHSGWQVNYNKHNVELTTCFFLRELSSYPSLKSSKDASDVLQDFIWSTERRLTDVVVSPEWTLERCSSSTSMHECL